VKLTKTTTRIFGLLCVVCGEDDRATYSTVTSGNASRSGRVVWSGVWLPMYTIILLINYFFETSLVSRCTAYDAQP